MPEREIDKALEAAALMDAFADRTGLDGPKQPQRYLWTDAFAVCNFLAIHQHTAADEYLDRALNLVEQVHHTLGRHRADDRRSGWISGLDEAEGELHPTIGGLRIGKPHPERSPDEPFDATREWDRDGQYFHYLTKWMKALLRMGRSTQDATFVRWAAELAATAYERFTYPVGRTRRMYWKMSIDLSRPLVPSMGQHDPLDGFITFAEIYAVQKEMGDVTVDLSGEIAEMARMCMETRFATDDPLGIGGLLTDVYEAAELLARDHLQPAELFDVLIDDAAASLASYARTFAETVPARRRLPFRELGLSIGLAAVERLPGGASEKTPSRPALRQWERHQDEFRRHAGLRERIERFWRDPQHRTSDTWLAHEDINAVMLATSLKPDGYLAI
ncbi:MAG: hypothetical protein ACOCTG_02845 [Bacteroidota bacterium]